MINSLEHQTRKHLTQSKNILVIHEARFINTTLSTTYYKVDSVESVIDRLMHHINHHFSE